MNELVLGNRGLILTLAAILFAIGVYLHYTSMKLLSVNLKPKAVSVFRDKRLFVFLIFVMLVSSFIPVPYKYIVLILFLVVLFSVYYFLLKRAGMPSNFLTKHLASSLFSLAGGILFFIYMSAWIGESA